MRLVRAGLVITTLVASFAVHNSPSRYVKPSPPLPPNVLIILTDDQGYGDLGIDGNDEIHTPNIDAFARESIRLTQFHVSPVCTPTRASLMTGRYNFRTRAIDTFKGRAMMHPEEVTLAQMLAPAGYKTGIFGKWHLGDNYPLRPMDHGFQECLVIRGGGLAQPSDPPGGDHYTNPILWHNGKPEKHKGYCTDIFTDAAIRFIEKNRDRPFFAYLATNAPHVPLEIDEKYAVPYRAAGLDDTTSRVYGMVTNIDENVGRLLAKLHHLKLEDNTIVIFMTDNGPQQAGRYNAGMRGLKGSVYEGGIRVPCFMRWPKQWHGGRDMPQLTAHIDVVPTLLAACGIRKPDGPRLDGRDLSPLLRANMGRSVWRDRTLYFQWHRGEVPELYNNCAARNQRYKLVNGKELYDLEADPGETRDEAAYHSQIVAEMRRGYEGWFKDVCSTRGFELVRIIVGTKHEDPTLLSRQDARSSAVDDEDPHGYWPIEVSSDGNFDATLYYAPAKETREAHLSCGSFTSQLTAPAGSASLQIKNVELSAGPSRLQSWLTGTNGKASATHVELKRLD